MGPRTGSLLLLLVAVTLTAGPACADAPHARGGWWFGLGFGAARGAFWLAGEEGGAWASGVSPQLRIGRMLGRRFGLGLEAQQFFVEEGTAGEQLPLQIKGRVTGQIWSLAGTWFPGPARGFWNGLFLRAGTGPALASFALAIPDPDQPLGGQELQARYDEWGWGALLALGYEARVTEHFAAGVQASSTHLWLHGEFRRVWFAAPVLHLVWYF